MSFVMLGSTIGNFIASFTGTNMSLPHSSIVYLVPCVILILLLLLLPDSPHHLVKIGNLEAAKKSIQWYHRDGNNVNDELEEVIQFVKATSASTFMKKLGEFYCINFSNVEVEGDRVK